MMIGAAQSGAMLFLDQSSNVGTAEVVFNIAMIVHFFARICQRLNLLTVVLNSFTVVLYILSGYSFTRTPYISGRLAKTPAQPKETTVFQISTTLSGH